MQKVWHHHFATFLCVFVKKIHYIACCFGLGTDVQWTLLIQCKISCLAKFKMFGSSYFIFIFIINRAKVSTFPKAELQSQYDRSWQITVSHQPMLVMLRYVMLCYIMLYLLLHYISMCSIYHISNTKNSWDSHEVFWSSPLQKFQTG